MNEDLQGNTEILDDDAQADVTQEPEVLDQESDQEEPNDLIADDQESDENLDWQTSDEDEQKGDGKSIPKRTYVYEKRKLKGKISERDDEIARLKAKIDSFEKNVLPQTDKPDPIKRPDDIDFDTNEDYQRALAKYENDLITQKFNELDQRRRQEQMIQQFKQSQMKAVEGHYERAGKLVEDAGINPEVYTASDTAVRQAMNMIRPGFGDSLVDEMISHLGEGSEKVMYYLGRNQNALNQMKSMFLEDPSGVKVSIFLGQQKERLTAPKKQKSRAPAPAPSANGNSNMGNNVKAIQKKYMEAHKKKDSQAAWNYRREARKAGIDTSMW